MAAFKNIKLDTNAKNMLDTRKHTKNLDDSLYKIGGLARTQGMFHGYIPIVTGNLVASSRYSRKQELWVIVQSIADYSAYVWYNARDEFKQKWWEHIFYDHLQEYEKIIEEEYFIT